MGVLRLILYQLQREQANKRLSLGQGEEVAVVGFGDVPDDALAQALAFAVLGGVVGVFGFDEQASAVRPGLDEDAPPVRRQRAALLARTALTTGLAQKWTVSVVVRLSERSRSWSARRS